MRVAFDHLGKVVRGTGEGEFELGREGAGFVGGMECLFVAEAWDVRRYITEKGDGGGDETR